MESCLCESKFWESTPAIIIIFNTCMLDLFKALHFTQCKALLSLVTNIFLTNQEFQSCISRTQHSPTHRQWNLAILNVCAASVVLCIAISSSWRWYTPLIVKLGKQSFSAITLAEYSLKLQSRNSTQNLDIWISGLGNDGLSNASYHPSLRN